MKDWVKLAELIIVFVGIVVSVFALNEIKQQSKQNAEQIAILQKSSEISNRVLLFREFYPKYSMTTPVYDIRGEIVIVSVDVKNLSDTPIAYDDFFAFRMYNCGLSRNVDIVNQIAKEESESALRDRSYSSIAPNETETIAFRLNLSNEETFMKEAKITDATFIIDVYTFLRLENIEQFDDFIGDVGFDFSDTFTVGNEVLNMPGNTQIIPFEAPLKWLGDKFVIVGSETCKEKV